jgi:hypothetical protein
MCAVDSLTPDSVASFTFVLLGLLTLTLRLLPLTEKH